MPETTTTPTSAPATIPTTVPALGPSEEDEELSLESDDVVDEVVLGVDKDAVTNDVTRERDVEELVVLLVSVELVVLVVEVDVAGGVLVEVVTTVVVITGMVLLVEVVVGVVTTGVLVSVEVLVTWTTVVLCDVGVVGLCAGVVEVLSCCRGVVEVSANTLRPDRILVSEACRHAVGRSVRRPAVPQYPGMFPVAAAMPRCNSLHTLASYETRA